jgi:Carbohydrate family 9 binding domain-like/Concanavalin A-like lectin/glucanases superfamily/Tetratricopeptide repeat
MKTLGKITSGLLFAAMAITYNTTFAVPASELLQQGLYAEEVEGNIDSAIKSYDQVAKDKSASPNQVAQALYREGVCYLKLKDEASARTVLERLVTDYSSQTEIVEKARPVLDDLTDFDPASLMPPGTLVYVEFGSPGRQVETILNMLKGTAFENPLAAMAGKQANNQKSPGDIVGALLNPSMMAEFKKIRGSAIGITGISQQNPPMISILYPGKSDALRGIILAALGMAGTPGQPLEGMQTLDIKNFGAVAYDDKVFITARPASQLEWCVKQYKGLISEPTLVSSNPSFARFNKLERQKNALTVWANVSEVYARLLQMFPPGQIPPGILSANAFMDFSNIDELTLIESVETNGLAWKGDIAFKNGHHCLAYNLIHTPNINQAALEAVPARAIALASFSLNPADPTLTEKARAEVQNVTGLDLGREIFANVEQVTVFAMPAANNQAASAASMFLPDHLGLAITSRNPEQTRQVLATVLGALSPGQQNAEPGKFKISRNGQRDLYCYMEQVNGITVLSLNREVADASVAAIKTGKSVRVSGPLYGAVHQLTPATSKLVLVNAGGAIRLLGPQMKVGPLNNQQATQFKNSLDQLAGAADATTIELRTDEQQNNFSINTRITGIPPLNQIVAPATQIAGIVKEARAEAVAKNLRRATPAIIVPATKTPAMDGSDAEIWANVPRNKLENVLLSFGDGEKASAPISPDDLSADFRGMWDENNLYLLVNVTDDILRHDTGDWYESDSVEVYIDADDAKAPQYGQNDYQYGFDWDKTSPTIQETKHNRTNGVEYAVVTTDKGYRLEIKFPWQTLGVKPSTGAKVGLDIQVNDNDGGGKRKSKIAWHATRDNAWTTPQAFGNAELAGLIGWWKFDETQGKIARDSSGQHHDGTLVGNAGWAKGKLGGALDLNGQGSFVRIADKSAFNLGGEITMAAWVNFRSKPVPWAAIISKGDTAWRLSALDTDLKFHASVGRSPGDSLNGLTTVNTDEWHHVTAVYGSGILRLYVDGKLEGNQLRTGSMKKNQFEVLIGENAERPGRRFNGLLDDVRVYNYALSESEIKALASVQ